MEDRAVGIAIEHAQAGQFGFATRVGFVVVLAAAVVADADAELPVEGAAVGRNPGKLPAHALPERLEPGEGRPRHGHQRDIVVGQVQVGAIEVVGQERAAAAAFAPALVEHEVIDQQLTAAGEQVGEAQVPMRAFEAVGLLDPYPGQGAAGPAEFVTLMGQGLFMQQQLSAGTEPFAAGNHLRIAVVVHGHAPAGGMYSWSSGSGRIRQGWRNTNAGLMSGNDTARANRFSVVADAG
ncbi:hypothetical protein D3C78_1239200 [compost metagenome]